MKDVDTFKLPVHIKKIAKLIAQAAETAIRDYVADAIVEEPVITNRWLGAVAGAQKVVPTRFRAGAGSVVWRASTLRSGRGVAAEEKRHGADIMGVAEINIDGRVARKGFLAQAKRAEPGVPFDQARWDELRDQADLMLKHTSESFVVVYSKRHGILFTPAISIVSYGRKELFDFNMMTLENFFRLHLACFIGDRRIDEAKSKNLDGVVEFETPEGLPVDQVLKINVWSESRKPSYFD